MKPHFPLWQATVTKKVSARLLHICIKCQQPFLKLQNCSASQCHSKQFGKLCITDVELDKLIHPFLLEKLAVFQTLGISIQISFWKSQTGCALCCLSYIHHIFNLNLSCGAFGCTIHIKFKSTKLVDMNIYNIYDISNMQRSEN